MKTLCRCDDEGVDLILYEHQGGRQRGLVQRGLTSAVPRGRAAAAVCAGDRARADRSNARWNTCIQCLLYFYILESS